MEIGKLSEWNPWWEDTAILEELKGKPRPYYQQLLESIHIKEITILTGVRRCGKSTLLYQMIDHLLKKGIKTYQILFVNLEDKKLTNDPLDAIYASYREHMNVDEPAYIFLDEIHRKEGWESWMRKKYDLKTKNKFIISGSCSHLLKKEYSTLLTGRNLTFEVFPLSFKEFLLFKGVPIHEANVRKGVLLEKTKFSIAKYLREYISLGGFPEVFFKEKDFKIKLLEQYFDDILYKDIIDRYTLDAQKAKDLALFLITNITSSISLRNLRNSLKLSYDTIKRYLSYYRESFLFFTLDHFSYSLKEQKTLPSKVYCVDHGLRNSVAFTFSKDEGKLVENLLFIELRRRGKEIYYWRDKGEIDFVIKSEDQKLTAMNVSYTDEIPEREVRSLIEFKNEFGSRVKELLLLTYDTEKITNGITYIPVWKFLLITERL